MSQELVYSRPQLIPGTDELAHLEFILTGAYCGVDGFFGAADADSVARTGRLINGMSWPVPVVLRIPAELRTEPRLTLCDPEGAPIALLNVRSTWSSGGSLLAEGEVQQLGPIDYGLFRSLRRPAREVAASYAGQAVVATVIDHPPHRVQLQALDRIAGERAARLLVLPVLAGPRPDVTTRAVLAAVSELQTTTDVVPILLPRTVGPQQATLLQAQVAAGYGATTLLTSTASPLADSPIPLVLLPELAEHGRDHREVIHILKSGDRPPPELTSAKIAQQLARQYRPPAESGLTVLFTGLSGAGKSTIARALRDEILLRDQRVVTLLDGDEVRRHLSAGLAFSADDRSRNLQRIGWVAAQIANHGGVALCSAIAPFPADRAIVRNLAARTGMFLLIHVATPLALCEQRDRKHLYARARIGELKDFTGISSPYEPPNDAELTIDTSARSVAESVAAVVEQLRARSCILW